MNSNDDRSWKLGVFYYNSEDPHVLVRKRMGIGWTLNMARPISWAYLLVPIALVIVGTHFASR